MAFGSYIRFGLGLIISALILWSYFAKEAVSSILVIFAVVYIILAILWFAFRF